jgi:hypothetical protein
MTTPAFGTFCFLLACLRVAEIAAYFADTTFKLIAENSLEEKEQMEVNNTRDRIGT